MGSWKEARRPRRGGGVPPPDAQRQAPECGTGRLFQPACCSLLLEKKAPDLLSLRRRRSRIPSPKSVHCQPPKGACPCPVTFLRVGAGLLAVALEVSKGSDEKIKGMRNGLRKGHRIAKGWGGGGRGCLVTARCPWPAVGRWLPVSRQPLALHSVQQGGCLQGKWGSDRPAGLQKLSPWVGHACAKAGPPALGPELPTVLQ